MQRNRIIGLAAAAVVVLVLMGGTGITMLQKASARAQNAQALNAFMEAEQASLAGMRDKSRLFERKRKNSKGKSVHEAVTQVIDSLGLKEKLTSLQTPSGAASAQEERAEALFEGITLNELVNLLYSLENSRMLILTRKVNIRTSFENPELLNVTLSVSLIKPQ